MSGTLYLIPVTLGSDDAEFVLPAHTLEITRRLTHFIVENAKSARQFLKCAGYPLPIQDATMAILDEHSRAQDVPALLAPLLEGIDCGLLSEAGCPAVADPGAALVRHAHEAGVRVVPLTGPSSILLALMASGFPGQRFTFHGYLPVAADARLRKLRELERDSEAGDATQIFIETPYRSASLMHALMEHCRPDTLLCVAADLTLSGELIATRAVRAWKQHLPALDKRLAVFLLYRHPR